MMDFRCFPHKTTKAAAYRLYCTEVKPIQVQVNDRIRLPVVGLIIDSKALEKLLLPLKDCLQCGEGQRLPEAARTGEEVHLFGWSYQLPDIFRLVHIQEVALYQVFECINAAGQVFQGKKELFKGLAIYDKPYDWKPYPIIHLDMANCDVHTEADLRDYLVRMMSRLAKHHGVSVNIQRTQLSSSFSDLIEEIAKEDSAVILLDEYDKPILENITSPDVLTIRDTLADFYSAIKKEVDFERFVFITGVSKFCHVSLFSKLNNLTDITMDARYATMLGYTQQEFETNFKEQIATVEKKQDLSHTDFLAKIKNWYDGVPVSNQ